MFKKHMFHVCFSTLGTFLIIIICLVVLRVTCKSVVVAVFIETLYYFKLMFPSSSPFLQDTQSHT